MSRVIMNCPKGKEVDHKNGNTLDNRHSNLRVCTHQENCRNRRPNKNCVSSYKGVSWFKGKWTAIINCNGKHRYLGRFKNEIDAAKAYDKAAKKAFGEFACLNFE